VRAINAIGDPNWIRLDADEMLEEARTRTGFSNFGDDDWCEPYEIFVKSAREEAQLNTTGRVILRHDLVTWLSNRLEVEETYRQHPEIEDVAIDKPIFITGLPRTGTSITHELMGQDPGSRVPLSWEACHPCPPPETASYETDPRIERTELEERLWVEIVPEYDSMHELGARIPVECVRLTAHSFRSDELLGRQLVPSYGEWFGACDHRPAYAYHKRLLKLLSWKAPGERWVLKAPSHLGQLEALLAIYPDARIIQTHRDPIRVIPSVASILYSTAYVRSDAVDPEAILGWFTGETCRFLLDRAAAVRESGLLPDAQVHDLLYADLMSDPIAAIGRAYEHFDISFTDEAQTRVRAYLDTKPKGKHGAHRYEFADTGLDVAEERARFADYYARFGIPTEG
jgi:hypothetical protein